MSEYTVQPDDAGKVIVVVVRFTDGGGYAEGPLQSAPTDPVLAPPNTPATGMPTIIDGHGNPVAAPRWWARS